MKNLSVIADSPEKAIDLIKEHPQEVYKIIDLQSKQFHLPFEDHQDIIQTIVCNLLEFKWRYNPQKEVKVSTWVSLYAKFQYLSFLRKSSKQISISNGYDVEDQYLFTTDIEQKEYIENLLEKRLKPKELDIIRWRFFKNETLENISKVHNCSLQYVDQIIKIALSKLLKEN